MSEALERLTAALADRYRIERELGAGGMATVYLAEDLRHDRKVALKVLRPELAAVIGAERFLQEIKTTANLQHPHILALFDSGQLTTTAAESGDTSRTVFYVMPYVEGESLRDRLTREKQLPVDTALRIATEVASALDYAHRHGVIHRDIKPENILLHDGTALVADFGIALAASTAGGARMTETGMSLGTPHYMSPEQTMGDRELTARSDVYALGCVLYEMLVGEPPFTGPTAQAIVARVMTEEPRSLVLQRKTIPAHVEAAVHTALEKLPADRYASAVEFAEALKGSATAAHRVTRTPVTGASAGRSRLARLGWGVAAVAGTLAVWGWLRPGGALLGGGGPGAPGSAEVRRWSVLLPDSAPLEFVSAGMLGVGRQALTVSPDGRQLVYVARYRRATQLFVRQLDEITAEPLAGTEGAWGPFFSPDGQSIGFFVGTELRKVSLGGGSVVTLAQVPEPSGATWLSEDRIVVAAREGELLAWVPPSGGELRAIPNPQQLVRTDPQALPGGDRVLVGCWDPRVNAPLNCVTELESGRTRALTVRGAVALDSVELAQALTGSDFRYLATGHLLRLSRGVLSAIPFDPVRLRPLGPPAEVLTGLRQETGGAGQYAVGADGTLLYAPGVAAELGQLVWADRSGRVDTLPFAPQVYGAFELSPDGRRVVAIVIPPGKGAQIWVLDLDRGAATTLVTRGSVGAPHWWPDGRSVFFTEAPTLPPFRLVTVRQLPGSAGQRDTIAKDWALNDVREDSAGARGAGGRGFGGGSGTWLIPLADSAKATPVDTFPTAWGLTISRDGKWLAYTSNEAGLYEVYAVNADQRGERQKISIGGGEEPRWSPRGDELGYRWGRQWFAVTVPSAGGFRFGRPRMVIDGPYINVSDRSHDIAPDGRRHLLVAGPREETAGHLRVVTNWLAELRRLAPRKE